MLKNPEKIIDRKKRMVHARKIIKDKLKLIKGEKVETSKLLESRFQPIVQPLQKLVQTFKEQPLKTEEVKEEEKTEILDKPDLDIPSTHAIPDKPDWEVPSTEEIPSFIQTPVVATNIRDLSSDLTLDTIKEVYSRDAALRKSVEQYTSQFGKEIQYYLKDILVDTLGVYDHTYGVYYSNGNWMIGDSKVEIYDNDLIIEGVTYKGSPGLYELIFLKHPDLKSVTENDLAKYKSILIATNAHKQKYLPRGRINANRGYKYVNVISKLFPIEHKSLEKEETIKTSTPVLQKKLKPITRRRLISHDEAHKGSGICQTNTISHPEKFENGKIHWKYFTGSGKQYKYIYWNHANELCNRLKILVAEINSGNNSKDIHNEILSIVEELKEENIIK